MGDVSYEVGGVTYSTGRETGEGLGGGERDEQSSDEDGEGLHG